MSEEANKISQRWSKIPITIESGRCGENEAASACLVTTSGRKQL